MTRRRFSERDVIETLAWQGILVPCFRCGAPFFTPSLDDGMFNLTDKIEREHLHEVALGGPDTPKNCRYSCSACHNKITNGTKATSAGSSKQRIAKVKRLRRETCTGPKKKIPSRPLKGGGKMQSRPFQKRRNARKPKAIGVCKFTASP